MTSRLSGQCSVVWFKEEEWEGSKFIDSLLTEWKGMTGVLFVLYIRVVSLLVSVIQEEREEREGGPKKVYTDTLLSLWEGKSSLCVPTVMLMWKTEEREGRETTQPLTYSQREAK